MATAFGPRMVYIPCLAEDLHLLFFRQRDRRTPVWITSSGLSVSTLCPCPPDRFRNLCAARRIKGPCMDGHRCPIEMPRQAGTVMSCRKGRT